MRFTSSSARHFHFQCPEISRAHAAQRQGYSNMNAQEVLLSPILMAFPFLLSIQTQDHCLLVSEAMQDSLSCIIGNASPSKVLVYFPVLVTCQIAPAEGLPWELKHNWYSRSLKELVLDSFLTIKVCNSSYSAKLCLLVSNHVQLSKSQVI